MNTFGQRVRAFVSESLRLGDRSESELGLRYLRLRHEGDELSRIDHPAFKELSKRFYDNAEGSEVLWVVDPTFDFVSVPAVVSQQHAIGHGGFHSGSLGLHRPCVRWIYDCGALRSSGTTALARAIEDYVTKGARFSSDLAQGRERSVRVDLLFVSHFDADHVSGLKSLLSAVAVDTVVVPYLDPVAQFAVLAEAAASPDAGSLAELTKLVFSPETWFRRNGGARRLLQIRPGSPGLGQGPFQESRPQLPDIGRFGAQQFHPTIVDPQGRAVQGQRPTRTASARSGLQALVAEPGTTILVHARKFWTDWGFVPYVHPATSEAIERARAAAAKLVGVPVEDPTFKKLLLPYLNSGRFRRSLKQIYIEQGLGDANAVSLSLYAGPMPMDPIRHRRVVGVGCDSDRSRSGWLLTGDAKLGNPSRRKAWLNYYKPVREQVGDLMLPHHGAAVNFHSDILDAVCEDANLFITAGAYDPKRPHEDVVQALAGRTISSVTEIDHAALRRISGPEVLAGYNPSIDEFFVDWR